MSSLAKRKAFAAALKIAMHNAGVNQSNLARAIWGETKDRRGHSAAKNRARISSYLSGRTMPSRETIHALANALGVKPEDLTPDIEADTGSQFALADISTVKGTGRFICDAVIPLGVATKIIEILRKETTT